MIPDEIQNFKKSASLTTNKFAKPKLTFAILCMRVSVIRLSTAELPFRINISLLNLTLLPEWAASADRGGWRAKGSAE